MQKNLEYKIFRKNIACEDILTIVCEINDSKDFELDELSHIILKGTNTKVGYIGNDTLELVNPDKKELIEYHTKLKNIFNYNLI